MRVSGRGREREIQKRCGLVIEPSLAFATWSRHATERQVLAVGVSTFTSSYWGRTRVPLIALDRERKVSTPWTPPRDTHSVSPAPDKAEENAAMMETAVSYCGLRHISCQTRWYGRCSGRTKVNTVFIAIPIRDTWGYATRRWSRRERNAYFTFTFSVSVIPSTCVRIRRNSSGAWILEDMHG